MKKLNADNESDAAIDLVKACTVLNIMLEGGGAATATEIAQATGTPLREVMHIMGHPEFVRRFTALRREAAKTEFNAVAHNRLRDIVATSVDESVAISAAKVWAGILGEDLGKKNNSGVSVSINFENIVKAAEEKGVSLDDKTTLFTGFD